MDNKKFWAFMGVSALIFALALTAGGCGGSSGSSSTGGGTISFSGHHILMGASGRTDSEASELLPHIRNLITDNFDLSRLSQLNTDGLIVTSKDIIFIEDASTIRANDENAILPIRHAFFNKHVTIAAIYPDAEDVKALGNILGVTLADPSSEPNSKYFEIVAASMRYASGDILPHTFIYIDKCTENRVHNNLYTVSYDRAASTTSRDQAGNDSPSDEELAERLREYEANLDERLKERVQKVIDWSAGIDDTISEFRDTLIQMASNFAFAVADETGGSKKDLLQFVGGTYTTVNDSSYSSCFFDYDYARRDGTQADDWYNNFTHWLGCSGKDDYSTLAEYWNSFTPGLDLTMTHISYGLHSFEDHCDYYVISTTAGIHPHSQLAIRAEYGDNTTGGEVKGSGSYHYAVVMGCDRDMSCYVWPDVDGINLVQMTPAATVNNDQEYSDTDGYSWTAGVTGGGSYGEGGQHGDGEGEGHLDVSFSYSVSHSRTKTFRTKDYNISVYNTHNNDGRPMAGWKVDVTPPSYENDKGWTISEAARSAVTLNAESIWKVNPDVSDKAVFKTQAHWSDGFYAAHDMSGGGQSHCDIHHDSGETGVNIVNPVKIGLADPVTNGTSEGKTYYAKIYSETNWTAVSNSDWLQLTKTSGGASNGGDFGYTATTNETGQDRIATITITSSVDSDDQIAITFTQSRYAN